MSLTPEQDKELRRHARGQMGWKLAGVVFILALACSTPLIAELPFLLALLVLVVGWAIFVAMLARGAWHWDQFLTKAEQAGAPAHMIRLGRSL